MVDKIPESSGREIWELPFLSMSPDENTPAIDVEHFHGNIDLWRDEVEVLEASMPPVMPENKFVQWRQFLQNLREDYFRDLLIKSRQWNGTFLLDNIRTAHRRTTRMILAELKSSLKQECCRGLTYVSDHLKNASFIQPNAEDKRFQEIKKSLDEYKEFCEKMLSEKNMHPEMVGECLEHWNRVNQRFEDFDHNMKDRPLPYEAHFPKTVNLHMYLLVNPAPFAKIGMPSTNYLVLASRFDSAANYARRKMQKLRDEILVPLALALEDSNYQGILNKVNECFEDQDDIVQSFAAECYAMGELMRKKKVVNFREDDETARMANSKARTVVVGIKTIIRTRLRRLLLKLYIKVLEEITNNVAMVERELPTNSELVRILEDLKIVKAFWRKTLMTIMLELSQDKSLMVVTNLKENDEYFEKPLRSSRSMSNLARFWKWIREIFA